MLRDGIGCVGGKKIRLVLSTSFFFIILSGFYCVAVIAIESVRRLSAITRDNYVNHLQLNRVLCIKSRNS